MKITNNIYSIISLFSLENTKIKRAWEIPFFNYIKIIWSTWVSYSFKAASIFDVNAFLMSRYYPEKNIVNRKVEFNLEQANKL